MMPMGMYICTFHKTALLELSIWECTYTYRRGVSLLVLTCRASPKASKVEQATIGFTLFSCILAHNLNYNRLNWSRLTQIIG